MAGIRVGIMDPLIASRPAVDTATRATYLSAVATGVDSFWVPDHLNSLYPRCMWKPEYFQAAKFLPSLDAYMEPWTVLGHTAARNRFARLRLGVGVTDSGRRNPAVTAQAAATLHLISRGRAILGIGPGEREGNEPYGIEWSKPVARFEEALATIKALWGAKGTLVNRDSPYFPLRNAAFDLPPYRGTRPEIWIGAHGPRMLRTTGRYADAYFPGFPHSPQDYARRLDIVRSAASDAGRDPMSITPAILLPVFTGANQDEVDEALSATQAKVGALLCSAEMFERHGAQHPLGAHFSGAQDILPQLIDESAALELAASIPDSVVRDMLLTGAPREALEKAAEWRDHGVRYFVVINSSSSQYSMRKGLTATIPFLKIVRGMKRL